MFAELAYGDAEDESDLVRQLVCAEHHSVVTALSQELGDNEIMASMWSAGLGNDEFPTPDDLACGVLMTDVSGEKLRAWQWISDGMPLE